MKKLIPALIIFTLLVVGVFAYTGFSRFDNVWVRGWLNVSGNVSVGSGATFLDLYAGGNYIHFNTTAPVLFNQNVNLTNGKNFTVTTICLSGDCQNSWPGGGTDTKWLLNETVLRNNTNRLTFNTTGFRILLRRYEANPVNSSISPFWQNVQNLRNQTILREANITNSLCVRLTGSSALCDGGDAGGTLILNSTLLALNPTGSNLTLKTGGFRSLENNPKNISINITTGQVAQLTPFIISREKNPTNATINITFGQIAQGLAGVRVRENNPKNASIRPVLNSSLLHWVGSNLTLLTAGLRNLENNPKNGSIRVSLNSTQFSFNGGNLSAKCVAITGSTALCDGNDASGGAGGKTGGGWTNRTTQTHTQLNVNVSNSTKQVFWINVSNGKIGIHNPDPTSDVDLNGSLRINGVFDNPKGYGLEISYAYTATHNKSFSRFLSIDRSKGSYQNMIFGFTNMTLGGGILGNGNVLIAGKTIINSSVATKTNLNFEVYGKGRFNNSKMGSGYYNSSCSGSWAYNSTGFVIPTLSCRVT